MHLHRHDVVDKATQLLDEYGIADLTMRRLARELSVTAGALYWHFADKQELLGAVADRILQPASTAVLQSTWSDRVLGVCSALRNALLSTTDGAELVSASFAAGKSAVMTTVLERLTAAASDAGIDEGNAGLAARTAVYYVLGFTADEQSRLQWDAAGALPDAQSAMTSNPNARFVFGLHLLINGMAAHRSSVSGDHGVHAGVAIPAS